MKRVKNVAGFYRGGQFHPIRADKKKYDADRAGDNDDIFDREIRKNRNEKKALETYQKQLENEIRREMYGDNEQNSTGQTLMQFVRSAGGIRRTRYNRGELDRLTAKESGKRGLVSDTKGKTLDKLWQSALEAGYDLDSTDDLISKLEDEAQGRPFYATRGYIDYRQNPAMRRKTNAKAKLTQAQIKSTAKALALLYPKQSAAAVMRKLKRNPQPSELAASALDVFDLDRDGDLDAFDVAAFDEFETPISLVITPDGEPARVVTALTTGDEFVVEFTDGERAGDYEVYKPEELDLIQSPELAQNPAALAKVGGKWRVILPNGKFLRIRGRVFESGTKARAVELASKIKLTRADQLRFLKQVQRPAEKNPSLLNIFANSAVGLASALQIKDHLSRPKKRRRARPAGAAAGVRKTNPAKITTAEAIKRAKAAGVDLTADFHRLRSAQVTALLDIAQAAKYRKSKTSPGSVGRAFFEYLARAARKANPAAFKRPAFEMFQGRKSTDVKTLPVSRHAPKSLDTLGKLIEIKLADGQVFNFERRNNPFRLCTNPRASRLWIAGGRFAKRNPQIGENEIEVIAPLEYVVYETSKPHIEGDNQTRHYIHALGEDSGELPEFALDSDGFPVIQGGAYTIEARGIVN